MIVDREYPHKYMKVTEVDFSYVIFIALRRRAKEI